MPTIMRHKKKWPGSGTYEAESFTVPDGGSLVDDNLDDPLSVLSVAARRHSSIVPLARPWTREARKGKVM
jgi:hypothetical protein